MNLAGWTNQFWDCSIWWYASRKVVEGMCKNKILKGIGEWDRPELCRGKAGDCRADFHTYFETTAGRKRSASIFMSSNLRSLLLILLFVWSCGGCQSVLKPVQMRMLSIHTPSHLDDFLWINLLDSQLVDLLWTYLQHSCFTESNLSREYHALTRLSGEKAWSIVRRCICCRGVDDLFQAGARICRSGLQRKTSRKTAVFDPKTLESHPSQVNPHPPASIDTRSESNAHLPPARMFELRPILVACFPTLNLL